MIVTEEEARTKRCQESFGPVHVTPSGEMISMYVSAPTLTVQTSPTNCIASKCMAWCWLDRDEDFGADSKHLRKGCCGKAVPILVASGQKVTGP
jgi:hypothetical protein